MLTAMSSGGRIGHDAPYMPRGCDMRWFSSEEICEILARFEKVVIVGDSMMRHVIGSLNVLIRKDLGYGAVTDWNFSPEERSLSCPVDTVDVMSKYSLFPPFPSQWLNFYWVVEQMIRFPIAPEELSRLRDLLPSSKPLRPYAFIFGHGLWNDLDLQATLDWLDLILDITISSAPWLQTDYTSSNSVHSISNLASKRSRKGAQASKSVSWPGKRHNGFWPRLFLTPNAAGKEKPDEWLVSQGNKALTIFEESVKEEAGRRGVEHLGTYNMSIQSNKFDGVHVDLKGNLIKAMMVLNWLNMLEVEKF
ncbi:hypothetical protein MMC17_006771 [Xylographa soralifera]|nr:hypothetical protein [Xylographa soralifera]